MNWFIWALLSAFFAGLTAILAKVGVQQIDSNLATAIRTVVILIFAWAVALVTKNQPFSSIGKRTWIFLILSGIATGLSWLCYFRALQLGEASQVAPVDKLSVVVAIVLAAIFLHEKVTWHHWLGGVLFSRAPLYLLTPEKKQWDAVMGVPLFTASITSDEDILKSSDAQSTAAGAGIVPVK